jgi:hypothetical protein
MALQFAEAAREQLALFIEAAAPAGLAGALANVETAQSLAAGSLGRPLVVRGVDPSDPRDNKVEVSVHESGTKNTIDRSLFDYHAQVVMTLFSVDSQVLTVQQRLLRWETAWWNLMSKGGSSLGGTVVAAICTSFSKDGTRLPTGAQIVVGMADILIRRQET